MILFLILSIILVIIISVYYFKIEKCKDRYTVLKSKINTSMIRNIEMNNKLDSINNNQSKTIKNNRGTKNVDKKVLQKDRLEEFQISENENSEEDQLNHYDIDNIIETEVSSNQENKSIIHDKINFDNIQDQDSDLNKTSCVNDTNHGNDINHVNDTNHVNNTINNNYSLNKDVRTESEIQNVLTDSRVVDKTNLLPEIKYRTDSSDKLVKVDDISCLVLDKPYINNNDNTVKPYSDQVYSPYISHSVSDIESGNNIEFFKSERLCQSISVKEIEVPCGTPVLPKSVSYSECEPCPLNEYTPESHPLEVKDPPSMCETPTIHDFYIRELDKDNTNDHKENNTREEVSLYDTVFNETKEEVPHEDILVRSNYKNNKSDYSGTDFIFHNNNNSQNLYNI